MPTVGVFPNTYPSENIITGENIEHCPVIRWRSDLVRTDFQAKCRASFWIEEKMYMLIGTLAGEVIHHWKRFYGVITYFWQVQTLVEGDEYVFSSHSNVLFPAYGHNHWRRMNNIVAGFFFCLPLIMFLQIHCTINKQYTPLTLLLHYFLFPGEITGPSLTWAFTIYNRIAFHTRIFRQK